MDPELIGWLSTGVLILTIGRQVYTQWKERSAKGVSRWLFVGQMASSIGFIAYSAMLGNWVFILSNSFMLAIAVIGQCLLIANKRREAKGSGLEAR